MQQVPLKTYVNIRKLEKKAPPKPAAIVHEIPLLKREPLTTKKAVELLLSGTIKEKVCRYCLYIDDVLSSLDMYMNISGRGALYRVTIRDMVAAVHPFKVVADPNFPNKICNKCLNKVIGSYLFAQQCEQSERALRNCLNDMFEKLEKLDPIHKQKKRGRQKLFPNSNILYTDHLNVIDYAEPIRNLINAGAVPYIKESELTDLECKKCWQVLPNVESLVNHAKIHPSSMWFHCRLCGKSFVKNYHLKKHIKKEHSTAKSDDEESGFECKQCGIVNENHLLHLQHLEKHKFQMVLEHMVQRNMDKLCTVCLDKGNMVDMDKVISLHGGYPELTGNRSLYNILGATVPEMNVIQNYTGTKICMKCLDHAIVSYVFINRIHYIRNRLDTCITKMLENLNDIPGSQNKLFIEIAKNGILPVTEEDNEDLFVDESEEIDESKLKVDILEDEFRMKSENEESDSEHEDTNKIKVLKTNEDKTKTYQTIEHKLVNGYQSFDPIKIEDVCSEFLTFKKKNSATPKCKSRFSCPICNKYFISAYYIKRHILKHISKKVACNICLKVFQSKFYLYEHVKFVHLLKKEYFRSCKTCGRIFTDEKKLKYHIKTHIGKECALCLKVISSQKLYDCHLQKHVSKLRVTNQNSVQTCSFCEKECPNDNKLSVHVNKVHLQIKPYGCDMCERQFYTERNMKSHKKVHSLKSKEKCEFCSKVLKCRKDLVVHLRQHIGMKPFKCFLCAQTFYSELKMIGHMKKWHGGSFCCKLCRKVFSNRSGLKNHVNSAHSVF